MAYTNAQLDELKAIENLDFAKATEFGTKHGISPRSVVAKAKALNLPYKTKAQGGKAPAAAKKADVRRKTDVAQDVNDLMDMNLKSLEKMTGDDLNALLARVKEVVGA